MFIEYKRSDSKPSAGDIKTLNNGDEYVRCYVMTNTGTPHNPQWAYLCPNGRQTYRWIRTHLAPHDLRDR